MLENMAYSVIGIRQDNLPILQHFYTKKTSMTLSLSNFYYIIIWQCDLLILCFGYAYGFWHYMIRMHIVLLMCWKKIAMVYGIPVSQAFLSLLYLNLLFTSVFSTFYVGTARTLQSWLSWSVSSVDWEQGPG